MGEGSWGPYSALFLPYSPNLANFLTHCFKAPETYPLFPLSLCKYAIKEQRFYLRYRP